MTGTSRSLFGKGMVLVLVAALFAVPSVSTGAEKPLEVGQSVPEFSFPGLDGRPVSFSKDIRGKASLTLFFFMTTACSACYEELQELDSFQGRNPGRVDVWCVAVDLRGAQTVAPFQLVNKFRVKYLIDSKFSLPRTFGFNYTPSLAIVDARGIVLHKRGGYSPNERLTDIIRTFLK